MGCEVSKPGGRPSGSKLNLPPVPKDIASEVGEQVRMCVRRSSMVEDALVDEEMAEMLDDDPKQQEQRIAELEEAAKLAMVRCEGAPRGSLGRARAAVG